MIIMYGWQNFKMMDNEILFDKRRYCLMKLGVFTVLLSDKSLEDSLAYLKSQGFRLWNLEQEGSQERPMLIQPSF